MTRIPCSIPLGIALLALAGCGNLQRLSEVGRPPAMTQPGDPTQEASWRPLTMPMPTPQTAAPQANSLWRSGSRAFFKDQRAATVGDILTVLVNIADAASLKNNTTANRKGNESLGLPNLLGLEATVIPRLLAGVDMNNVVGLSSANGNAGTGEMKRDETVTLKLAGVVTQVLPNGNLVVAARQEVRVNAELRELAVSGVIRPQDIGSDNTVRHDRMAEARIAYGGRGQLTDLQTPRWGQQVLDIVLPF
ncbi:MAG: flagellar basal body L-ring protein FlgH [Acetobacteraceae bacterium]|nr:flagellar basal body L-ring protein FlgH [Acetobacteraceae bacterium]